MRLVLSWLREFVDVTASAEEIAEKLSLRGFEVASVEPLGKHDAVIDFEITANRPDCLSVLGLAREVATVYRLELRLPSADPGASVILEKLPTVSSGRSDHHLLVALEEEQLCPRYAAAVAEAYSGPSPGWLASRLEVAGIRPISTIVDITNYVNLEIGQPMHAFDLAKLAGGQLRIRRAKQGEIIRTLDGVERKLDPDMLVIADSERAQAIAGVMGGAASEVSSSTTRVALESAYFDPVSVRRTSKRLALKTEASTRFERGADIGIQVVAIERAAALMKQIGAGRIAGPVVDCYPHKRPLKRLHLRRRRLASLLGADVPDADVDQTLRGLGLDVESAGDGWDVVAPTFRMDLAREADLIEEVGRHYGFDRLASTFPPMTAPSPPPDAQVTRDALVRRVLTAAGMTEAATFGFIEAKAAQLFAPSAVAVANPLSGKFDTLRPLMLPGLVDSIAHNRRHGRRDARLFEIGTRFRVSGEIHAVAMAWTGAGAPEHWSGGAREVDFFDIKGLIEHLCRTLRVWVRFDPAHEPFLVSGQAALVVASRGPEWGDGPTAATASPPPTAPDASLVLGFLGQLLPAVADLRGLPKQDGVFVAELDLDAIERARAESVASETAAPLPRHPFVVRDLSIVVSDTLPAEIIRGTIQATGRALAAPLVGVSFFDRYKGKGVPEGAVSLAVRLTFQASDRTLTDAEVQQSFDAILAALVREHQAVQR